MQSAERFEAFLDDVKNLNRNVLLELSVQPTGAAADALETARIITRRTVTRLGLTKKAEQLRGQIVCWAGANGAQSGMWIPTGQVGEIFLADLRRGASQAVYDAAIACYLGRDLGIWARSAMWQRWERATGQIIY